MTFSHNNHLESTVYFDLSDVLAFAAHHAAVTGIQRVQMQVIGALVKQHGTGHIRAIAYCQPHQSVRHIDLGFMHNQANDDFEYLHRNMRHLLDGGGGTQTPIRQDVQQRLRKYQGRPLRRAFHWLRLTLRAKFAPHKNRSLQWPSKPNIVAADVDPAFAQQVFQALPSEASYVILGAGWAMPEAREIARRHRAVGGKVVQLIYDLIPVQQRDLVSESFAVSFEQWLTTVPDYASHCLAISECSARDFRHWLGSTAANLPVRAVPLAHEFSGHPRHAGSKEAHIRPALRFIARWEYVLCPGTIEVRKNGLTLLRAWQAIQRELGLATPRLVFLGREGWLIEPFKRMLVASGHLDGMVEIVHEATDEELAFLYRKALFVAMPSLYEGWGLPIGEGLWFDKFCVASSTSSMPEVGGDLIDYADPYDADDLKQKLMRPLMDRAYLRLREEAIRAAVLRTWDDVASDMMKAIQAPL